MADIRDVSVHTDDVTNVMKCVCVLKCFYLSSYYNRDSENKIEIPILFAFVFISKFLKLLFLYFVCAALLIKCDFGEIITVNVIFANTIR